MSTINQLPPERDLSADRRAHMRARLLIAIAQSDPRRTAARRRPVLVLAAGLAAATCAATAIVAGSATSDQRPEVYALGDSVLSAPVRQAGRECLELASHEPPDKNLPKPVTWPKDSPPVLLNHIEVDRRGALLVYQTRSTLIYCGLGPYLKGGPRPPDITPEEAWGAGLAWLESSPWLPGPISMEYAGSTKIDGGYVHTAGRVSARVARVVLDDGTGHRSTARLANGTYVVFSADSIVGGTLISYDTTGKEIDRRPAIDPLVGKCFTDPAGKLVNPAGYEEFDDAFRSGAVRCQAAEPWSGRNDATPTPQ